MVTERAILLSRLTAVTAATSNSYDERAPAIEVYRSLYLEYHKAYRSSLLVSVIRYRIAVIEVLLVLEYRWIKGLCSLKVAIVRPGACNNDTLVCVQN